ncbi:TIGR03915 family putative DNA repair protein [Pelotalea chapellei]|uniref:TIGR03915 family putative DNA repair protein n=1 Tax=Pelotalea chapellei TaxID=44671 RepID=A0ABS5U3H0_9BACT|nr:TIGR03915 family putative DNA repair protein [Pelotalea chapellei]MBT1070221.1 TIGR03915 family putative DNA repair protein [Pelotalea chapellei]
MKIYRYDGSFEGFICAVAACREEGDNQPEFVRDRDDHAVGLFAADVREVLSVRETALAFRKLFIAVASRDAFAVARYAFHSQKSGIEELLWRYLKLGLEVGPKLARMLAQEPVHAVNRIARQVSHEAHKFKGFVRFSEVAEGFLYARIEPQADILPLIAHHFTERVGDRPWMIHDIGRSQAAVFDLKSWWLVRDIELVAEPDISTAEQQFADLWQRYFQRLAITERHNPKLQQKHVPLRYRKHLTEFNWVR